MPGPHAGKGEWSPSCLPDGGQRRAGHGRGGVGGESWKSQSAGGGTASASNLIGEAQLLPSRSSWSSETGSGPGPWTPPSCMDDRKALQSRKHLHQGGTGWTAWLSGCYVDLTDLPSQPLTSCVTLVVFPFLSEPIFSLKTGILLKRVNTHTVPSTALGCECSNHNSYSDSFDLGKFKSWRASWRRRALRLGSEDSASGGSQLLDCPSPSGPCCLSLHPSGKLSQAAQER